MFKRSISSVLLIAIISLSGASVLLYPKPAEAITTFDIPQGVNTAWSFVSDIMDQGVQVGQQAYNAISAGYDQWMRSESILAQAARAAAEILLHQVLSMLTNQVITWIQGGGEPKFVSDWQGFLSDAVDKAGGAFVDKYLGAGYLCNAIDLDIKIALLDVPKFEDRVQCTLSDMGANIENFYNDFSQGGWTEWIELSKPQNNFYGAFLMAQDEKAKQEEDAKNAALNEAQSAEGFLSPKVCVKGGIGDNDTCSDKDTCKSLKESNPGSFYCSKEIVVTPGSVISDITSKAVNQPIKMLEDQIADLTDSMGILGPYVTAIGSALTNRVIQEGLAYVQGSDPNDPPGNQISPIDETPTQVIQDQDNTQMFIDQLALFQENLNDFLLTQQQTNLSIMQSIELIQIDTLDVIANIVTDNCSLPSGTNSQVISTISDLNSSGEGTITEIINITKSGTGTIQIQKITTIEDDDDLWETYSYQIISVSPQITNQIINLEEDIAETNQTITDIGSTIISSNGYLQSSEDYINLYENTLQPPTTGEQAILDAQAALVEAALNIVIDDGNTALGTVGGSIAQLTNTAQNNSITVMQAYNNLIIEAGFAAYPQPGDLYYQKGTAQSALNQVENSLNNCLDDD